MPVIIREPSIMRRWAGEEGRFLDFVQSVPLTSCAIRVLPESKEVLLSYWDASQLDFSLLYLMRTYPSCPCGPRFVRPPPLTVSMATGPLFIKEPTAGAWLPKNKFTLTGQVEDVDR